MSSLPQLQPQAQSSDTAAPVTYNSAEQVTARMAESWQRWEGATIDGVLPLRRYLGGSDRGAVFLTEYGERHEDAAIRLMPADGEGAGEQLAHWQRAAGLQHPNLLGILQSGRCELGGTTLHYIVTEYADENLAQILPHRPLTPAEVRQLLSPVLDVLACIHSNGFVHGRIRPANVMARADQIKLSSDSLCPAGTRSKGDDSVYCAHEAGSGLTPAGDIWSLGVTLVEVLTLRRPVWQAVSGGGLVLPEGIPQPFLEIAQNCLHLVPERRWTVAEIQARLDPDAVPPAKPVAAPAEPRPVPPVPGNAVLPDEHKPVPPAAKHSAPKLRVARPPYLTPVALGVLVLIALVALRIHYSPPAAPYPQAQEAQVPLSDDEPQEKEVQSKPTPAVSQPAQSAEEGTRAAPAETNQKASPSPAKAPPFSVRPGKGAKATATPPKPLPGSVTHQVLPSVSQSARNTIQGHVRVSVKVSVDDSGNVTEAVLDSPGPSKYFARLAEQAAREWKFAPPEVNGQKVPSQWILHFAFGRSGTDVRPVSVGR